MACYFIRYIRAATLFVLQSVSEISKKWPFSLKKVALPIISDLLIRYEYSYILFMYNNFILIFLGSLLDLLIALSNSSKLVYWLKQKTEGSLAAPSRALHVEPGARERAVSLPFYVFFPVQFSWQKSALFVSLWFHSFNFVSIGQKRLHF